MSFFWFSIIFVPLILCKPIFFEMDPNTQECVYDTFESGNEIHFFYQVISDEAGSNIKLPSVKVVLLNPDKSILYKEEGFQNTIRATAQNDGLYGICFVVIKSYSQGSEIIVGIDMLGIKSDIHFHGENIAKGTDLKNMYDNIMNIGETLEELESIQSATMNIEYRYWDSVALFEDRIHFYSWIKGWILIIVFIYQIKQIRVWFKHFKNKSKTPNYKV